MNTTNVYDYVNNLVATLPEFTTCSSRSNFLAFLVLLVILYFLVFRSLGYKQQARNLYQHKLSSSSSTIISLEFLNSIGKSLICPDIFLILDTVNAIEFTIESLLFDVVVS